MKYEGVNFINFWSICLTPLCSLKVAYRCFKDTNPTVKIGFSKFAELRPRDCVLAGASGTQGPITSAEPIVLRLYDVRKCEIDDAGWESE